MTLPYLALTLLLASAPAHAIVGKYLGEPASVPQSCRIYLLQRDGTKVTFCSSTQVSADEVVTAGHCFGEYYGTKNLHVECPGEEPRRIEKYAIEKSDRKGGGAVVIRVSPAFKAKPACLPSSPQATRALIESSNKSVPGKCLYAGYGTDNEGDRGTFHSARAGKLELDKAGQYVDVGSPVESGDSGGSLYCLDPEGRWYFMGIIQHGVTSGAGSRAKTTSYADSIETVRPWIDRNSKGDRSGCEPKLAKVADQPESPCPPKEREPRITPVNVKDANKLIDDFMNGKR